MPLEALAEVLIRPVVEFVLQPIAEGLMHAVGYLTGVVVVPLVTLGHVVVEQPKGGREIPPGKYWARSPGGRIVLDADWGTVVGVLTWVLVGVAAAVVYCNSGP
ncbi:hypothetical protein A3K87_29135 [Variovorax paradoxus]|uniref:Uncharacterized protein n=1 Tax=Variovorax paradoxus TaxID=34073 RepID=A0AA91DK01_VARPD|nr:hypothetical protein [Variovorax paradoxus]OAK58269.1 hypothetical protein A3K87_29135 [Variovorax paradoxus]